MITEEKVFIIINSFLYKQNVFKLQISPLKPDLSSLFELHF